MHILTRIVIALVLHLSALPALAQQSTRAATEHCLTTPLLETVAQDGERYRDAQTVHEQRVVDRILTAGRMPRGGGVITLPIVVHVVHDGGSENLSDATVIMGLELVNAAFANEGSFQTPDGAHTGIQFCLAQRDPDGNATTGIEHIQSPLTDVTAETQDVALKALSHWDPLSYVNLYVVRSITSIAAGPSVAGYAFLPGMAGQPQDGAVVESIFLGNTADNVKVTVHELGHYLGLYHTFEGGCGNLDCLNDGDRVCDTPPDASTASVACTASPNSCTSDGDDTSTNNPFRPIALGGLGDQPDQFENYMDYGERACQTLFSQGQGERMVATLQTSRASLTESLGCVTPCPIPFDASVFLIPPSPIPVGTTVNFIGSGPAGTAFNWELDGEPYATTQDCFAVFTEEGFHTVQYTVTDETNNCIDQVTIPFEVDCPGQASFTLSATQVLPGQSVTATNTSSGGTNYTWHLDGAPYSSDVNLVLPIAQPGTYTLFLTSSNGVCTNTSTSVTISTGECSERKREMHWYFGDYASLDFNSGVPIPGSSSALTCSEGTGCISDTDGNLLLYTNGRTVWDRTHQVMPNGTGLLAGPSTSSFNQALVLPWPGDPNAYCVITMDEIETGMANGVRWSKVDMTLNNGLGAVTLKNQFLHAGGAESMAATYHANGSDIWVVFPRSNPAMIQVYRLTTGGFQAPTNTTIPGAGNIGRVAMGHQGKRLAVYSLTPVPALDPSWHLFDFNTSTGALTNRLDFPVLSSNYLACMEFSPNDQVLYVQEQGALRQFDLSQTTASAIQASQYTIPAATGWTMRSAPDGKIYRARNNQPLDCIGTPNNLGAACNYSNAPISVAPGMARVGLPLFVRGAQFTAEVQLAGPDTACREGYIEVLVQNPESNCSYEWFVNDVPVQAEPGDTLLIVSNVATASAQVRVEKACPCGYVVGTHTVYLTEAPEFSLGADTVVCSGQALLLDAGLASSYNWSTGSVMQTATITAPGTVWAQITTSEGCVLSDTIVVQEVPLVPPVELGPNDSLCLGQVRVLDAGPGYLSYLWHDLSMDQTFTVFQPGTYWVTVTSACGASSDSITITSETVDLIDLGPDQVLCDDEPVLLDASGAVIATVWNDGSSASTLLAVPPGLFWVEVLGEHGCAQRDTILLLLDEVPPNLVCPTDTTVIVPSGATSAALTLNAPAVSDACAFTIVNDFNGTDDASGDYPLGTTIVNWSATDEGGNTSTCSYSVLVTSHIGITGLDCPMTALSIVPNPNDGNFRLMLPCASERVAAVLVDILGQEVSPWFSVQGVESAIAANDLAPGHYFLRVVHAGGQECLPVLVAF